MLTANEDIERRRLDAAYQVGFATLTPGEKCPPCPRCGKPVTPWDYWLVTGVTCEHCGWGMSEGSGCLS